MISDYLADYHSLPGVEGGRLSGPMCSTISDFRAAMVGYRACSSAGDLGAVMVWKDDDGLWRVAFQRYGATINANTFRYKSDALAWLRDWMPMQHHHASTTPEASHDR